MPRIKVKWTETHEKEFDIPESWDVEDWIWEEYGVDSLIEIEVLDEEYIGKSEND